VKRYERGVRLGDVMYQEYKRKSVERREQWKGKGEQKIFEVKGLGQSVMYVKGLNCYLGRR
jgi:hypothetical protein